MRYGHRGVSPAPQRTGLCPVCGWKIGLTSNGRLCKHKDYRLVRAPYAPAPWCAGSGRTVEEAGAATVKAEEIL
jgi:hypothetical protein